MSKWTTADIPSQGGRRAIVTGATGGLGYETALALAMAGADVILAGRNEEKGVAALRQIAAHAPPGSYSFEKLDLASLASVAAFADRMLAAQGPIDILVNNAAVMSPPQRGVTADGFELQFGTNYLGHFALTGRLLPTLRKSSAPRVVNLSSLAHRGGKIDFADLQADKKYTPWKAYQQSKLAMLMFAFELQRRSDAAGFGIMSNAAHPGYARTDLIPNGPGSDGFFGRASALLGIFFSHSAADGALPTLFAATSPAAQPMGYYGPDGFYEMKGPVAPSHVAPQARDKAVARRLWDVSEELTGIKWPVA